MGGVQVDLMDLGLFHALIEAAQLSGGKWHKMAEI
jgi:hypothetical protein